jgi:mitochondrial fission protein ELM1
MGAVETANLTAWALTTGEAGMQTQARGLARAVAGRVVEKVVQARAPWRYLPIGRLILRELEPGSDRLEPPWPDLIVSCGRRSALLALEARRRAGGKPTLVHVQDPRVLTGAFDLVVAMAHDKLDGPNVLKVTTALHDVTPGRLAAAAGEWRERLSRLPRPLVGVILGGPSGRQAFGAAEGRALLGKLLAMKAECGGGLAVVPSRRTPHEVLAMFVEAAKRDPAVWTWAGDGDNPYLGVLALADRLVVTGDSVSMVSEALATPHPVEVFSPRLRDLHRGFIGGLEERGLIRLLDGRWTEAAPRPMEDATAEAAAAVRRMLASRRKLFPVIPVSASSAEDL